MTTPSRSNPEIVNLALLAIDGIRSGTQQNPGIRPMNTRRLWPVTRSNQSREFTTSSVAAEPIEVASKSELPAPLTEEYSEVAMSEPVKEAPEQSSRWWLWLVGLLVVVGGVLVLRLQK